MQNPQIQTPQIASVEYQQGELAGYVALQVEHIVPRSRGGSDRVSNLCMACASCNQAKGNQTAGEFGHPEVQAKAKAPLRDAAAINTARWALFRRLGGSGLPLETGTGGRTKFNRTQQGLPKTHWLDAACVGASTPLLRVEAISPLLIAARGHGNRQTCRTDRYGFPVRYLLRCKSYLGFRTGDLVRAVVPSGKHAGVHVGCVTIRQRPRFRINGHDVHPRYLMRLQKADGYAYAR
jgi:hypothetical protein